MHQYEYDLFISYAHLDNELTDTGTAEGWITAFQGDLQISLSHHLGRRATIWRDDQLTPDDDFEAAIVTALKKSAVLVIVMSPTFVERQWFDKEFSAFINAAEERGGLLINDLARTFNVMIRATPREQMPDHLRKLLGYEFFLPAPEHSGSQTLERDSLIYKSKLDDLSRDIRDMLEALHIGGAT
jgi:hypothetical protein